MDIRLTWANIGWVRIDSTVHLDHNKTTILCDKTQFHIYTSEFHRKATHVKCLATEVNKRHCYDYRGRIMQ